LQHRPKLMDHEEKIASEDEASLDDAHETIKPEQN
jgi:hypothetical protein